MEVVSSLSQGRTAAAQCGLFTHKSVPVIFEPPCISSLRIFRQQHFNERGLAVEGEHALTRRRSCLRILKPVIVCVYVYISLFDLSSHFINSTTIGRYQKKKFVRNISRFWTRLSSRIENKIYLPAGSLCFLK